MGSVSAVGKVNAKVARGYKSMIHKLIKIANQLDTKGCYDMADELDAICREASHKYADLSVEQADAIYRTRRNLESSVSSAITEVLYSKYPLVCTPEDPDGVGCKEKRLEAWPWVDATLKPDLSGTSWGAAWKRGDPTTAQKLVDVIRVVIGEVGRLQADDTAQDKVTLVLEKYLIEAAQLPGALKRREPGNTQ